ncbi:MAG TPA: DUF1360 domain-containing protein [Candidatus Paceibacterota bacterium]|nr:DUF1360 domain-containing protein [Candidatus Paceibacterota bacterium]
MRTHFWHIVFLFLYVILAYLGYAWLAANGRLAAWIPLTDFFLMALAIMRLVRLFTYDLNTAFIRGWFADADPRSLAGTLGALINCPWCTGLWCALLVVFFYFATPIAWYAILVLALAALGSLFQLIANLVGWYAEYKKDEVHSIALPR